ncbi:FkbM family methyltransferase [Polynucleobacter difficilis]|uniref:FkbM family methyltransferase n=1 Tax=Polynucleobacter difficilis TaxID=556054 RepID=UPI000D350AEE|nr:FkbM family methyltransferase [Polynucleobacter difficilis]
MKKVTNNPFIASFLKNKYRDFILKPALKLLNRNQKTAQCAFWTMPYDSICQSIILNGFYERELLQGMCALIKDKKGVALDIGANIGNHSLFFSKHFDAVISFEPVPNNCLLLKANLFLNQAQNITLIEKALSNTNTKMGIDKGNSRNTNNTISELSKKDEDATNQIMIDVAVGDEVIEALNLKQRIALIKIDVEGHEPFVVEGLRKIISANQPIVYWEAFNKEEAEKTRVLLIEMGYSNFYHLTTKKYQSRLMNKLIKSFTNAAYLAEFDQCTQFDGMNVASVEQLL